MITAPVLTLLVLPALFLLVHQLADARVSERRRGTAVDGAFAEE